VAPYPLCFEPGLGALSHNPNAPIPLEAASQQNTQSSDTELALDFFCSTCMARAVSRAT